MKESQLNNKTSIATNDYVRMVDEDGNSVKIKKDSFMAAIRDALPSILESGGTGGGSVLSVIGGILKTRTDANLASVLGAPTWIALTSTSDLNDCYKVGAIYFHDSATTTNMLHLPSGISGYFCVWTVRQGNSGSAANRYIQFCQDFSNIDTSTNLLSLYLRLRFPAGNWSKWNKISTTVRD